MNKNKLDEKIISKSIEVARRNWKCWSEVYEHNLNKNKNPLLMDKDLFNAFCHEYSVGRTIRKNTREDLRKKLIKLKDLGEVLKDSTGGRLDKLESELRPDFGTREGKSKLISFVSKVAAFLSPENFIAYDQYAKKGVRNLLGRRKMNNYATYLEAVKEIMLNKHDAFTRQVKKAKGPRFETDRKFLMRVLDVYLMKVGDRKMNINN